MDYCLIKCGSSAKLCKGIILHFSLKSSGPELERIRMDYFKLPFTAASPLATAAPSLFPATTPLLVPAATPFPLSSVIPISGSGAEQVSISLRT